MKLDFERRSGLDFDDVRVHYHSDKPARLGALAYTQGSQVYLGPGQERHLPHELGHVVQQKMGLVKPTRYAAGMPLNDSPDLERMADQRASLSQVGPGYAGGLVIQRKTIVIPISETARVEIDEAEIRDTIFDVFKGTYSEEAIADILNNLEFKEVTEQLKQAGIGPCYMFEGEKHVIYYSTDPEIYKKVPDMLSDFYREGTPNAEAKFIREAFMATAVHEFGHAVQRELFKHTPDAPGRALNEHHNVLMHENLYPERKRGAYNPPDWIRGSLTDGYWEFNKAGKKQKALILKLLDAPPLSGEQLGQILGRLDQAASAGGQNSTSPIEDKQPMQQKTLKEIVNKLTGLVSADERDSDFLKSLLSSLVLESDTRKWFAPTFETIMSEVFPAGRAAVQPPRQGTSGSP